MTSHVTQSHSKEFRGSSSVAERPLCILQHAEGLGFDHLVLHQKYHSQLGSLTSPVWRFLCLLIIVATASNRTGSYFFLDKVENQ